MSVIRPIRPWEKRKLRDHLLRLDPEARRARFGGELKDAAIVRFVRELDRASSVNLGYFERGVMRGSIQLIRHPSQWFEGAELSLAVEREWRGRGLGRSLLDAAMTAARRRGIGSLYLSSMLDNDAVRALAARHGAVLDAQGAVEGFIHLPRGGEVWRRRRSLRVRAALAWRRFMRRVFAPRPAAG